MPSAAARRMYEDQIPPFMTVFDLDAETMADQETVTVVNPKMMDMDTSGDPSLVKPVQAQSPLRPSAIPAEAVHKHHDSTSTQASESAESSPTTTLSTTDSSPLSDPSPSSSPDSPVNLIPLSSFPATSFGGLAPLNSLNTTNTLSIPENSAISSNGRPMTSPAPRRPKNMKGLSIQPPCISSPKPVDANPNPAASEPASPSFIKPTIPAMKRKPSQLSLKTNSSDLIAKTTLEVPSTPSMPPIMQRRALKHSTSSPHVLSGMKSATVGPVGGMCFPKVLERNESGLSELLRPTKTGIGSTFDVSIKEEDSPIRSQIASRAGIDSEPYHEPGQNEDQKTPGYPDGPIAIYDEDVYLYLEPAAEEAARFDTVINVAREVRNPFNAPSVPRQAVKAFKLETIVDQSPVPDTAVTDASFATAFEYQLDRQDESHVETPTTPKAMNFPPKQPEYIHMPWDHNTDIAQDLMHLCETIDSRVKEGKKVLVHCQQGASRSASLIIAYGIYRNPELSVNDAYYAAQAKSQWISPNMRLMYCLQDFHKQMSKRKASPGSALRPRTGRSPTKHRLTLSADAIEVPPKEPRTAPLPGDEEDVKGVSPTKEGNTRSRGYSTPGDKPISPGPSSAPSSFNFNEKSEKEKLDKPAHFDLDRLLPQVPPQLPPIQPTPAFELQITSSLTPPSAEFSMKPPPSPGFGSHRFGPQATFGGMGFSSLNLGPSPKYEQPEAPKFEAPRLPRASDPQTEREVPKKCPTTTHMAPEEPDFAALMSPRAETMTNNPLHQPCHEVAGMHFAKEEPPTPGEDLFSPRQTMFPRDPFFPFVRPTQIADPRSPPTKGETPIVRSIDDLI